MERQAEKLTVVLALALALAQADGAMAQEGERSAAMRPMGWRYSVPVSLNGGPEMDMVVDTGSTFTIISSETARALGLGDLSDAPRYPINAAGGMAWVRLVILEKVTVAGVTVAHVEGAVADLPSFKGAGGLLGRSFLDRFIFRMDGANKIFSLLPHDGALYGGRGEGWWKAQARRLSAQARLFRAMELGVERGLKTAVIGDIPPGKLSKGDAVRLSAYFSKLLENFTKEGLEAKAPEEWLKPAEAEDVSPRKNGDQ